ncbi:MAG: integrase arm-type DNA-binding domain-containing protein [Burkholderiaceae bacterium]
MNRLTDRQCRAAQAQERAYKLSDGDGMYLFIAPTGGASWRLDYRFDGKRKTLALGIYRHAPTSKDGSPTITLSQARVAKVDAQQQLGQNIDPSAARVAKRDESAAAKIRAKRARADEREARARQREKRTAERNALAMTVETVAEAWHKAHRSGWTVQHSHQVWQSLADHVLPVIGRKPIVEVTSTDVLDLLGAMLDAGLIETASRVKQRLVGVWQFAVLRGDAPADVVTPTGLEFKRRRKGALRVKPKQSFPCVSVDEFPALLRAMSASPSGPIVFAAMWLLCLTGVRTGELRMAKWFEFDLDGDEPKWVIPVARMKIKVVGERAAADHVVPLSGQAVAILRDLKRITSDGSHGWVLPQDRKPDKPISENAILVALASMNYKGRMTGHGFRSLFATITRELGYRDEVVERQLAHTVGNAVARAYDRAALLPERRAMMQAYADHLDRLLSGEPAKVLRIHARQG